VNVRVVERTGAGRCGYCRDQLHEEHRSSCPSCSAAYHRDCAAELGRCGTRGCLGAVVAVERPAAPRRSWDRGDVVQLLLVAAMLLVSGGTIGHGFWRLYRMAVAEREADAAAAVAEAQRLEGLCGELAGIAQFQPTGARLARARVVYQELLARGVVDRSFVEEQVRRGRGDHNAFFRLSDAPSISYPDGGTLEQIVDSIVR
jgi:hypothetical protein